MYIYHIEMNMQGLAMPLYIRDDEVRSEAERLARSRHCTITEAVRVALREANARVDAERAERERRLDEALARLDNLPRRSVTTDRDLYDDEGMPVL
jgi:hypothetical protein